MSNGGKSDAQMLPAADEQLTLKGITKPQTVTLAGDGTSLDFDYADSVATVRLPAARRTKLVDVVQIQLPRQG